MTREEFEREVGKIALNTYHGKFANPFVVPETGSKWGEHRANLFLLCLTKTNGNKSFARVNRVKPFSDGLFFVDEFDKEGYIPYKEYSSVELTTL